MEWEKLPAIVLTLVLIGLIVGVGVLVLDMFGDAAKDDTALNETLEVISDTATAGNDEIVSIQYLYNDTVTFTANTHYNFTADGAATITTSGLADQNYSLNYTYEKDVTTTTTMSSATSAVGGIATDWMALIVTIMVLALILGMVVRSFGKGSR